MRDKDGESIVPTDPIINTEGSSSPSQQEVISSTDRTSANSACVACRSKHLKCDGLPGCSRCASQGVSCVYLKSRRGYRGSAARDRTSGPASGSTTRDHTSQTPSISRSSTDGRLSLADRNIIPSSLYSSSVGATFMSTRSSNKVDEVVGSDGQSRQRCMDAFYHYFYGSHPFLPPRHILLRAIEIRPMYHLQTAMCYIGSRYTARETTATYAIALEALVESPPVKDSSMVQAILLYALGLDGGGEQTQAATVLVKAQSMAFEIGMNTREYAIANGQGSSILEESLRRSWHELYVVCVMFAGFHGKRAFDIQHVTSLVPLPCEARDFEVGSIPGLHTLEDFDEEDFVVDDIEWSSYAYRIAAARNLDRIIKSIEVHLPDHASSRLEAYLTTWKLHLPESKKACYDETGTFDEMMFQAHMITEVSSILLHRHFSRLESLPVQTITSCSEQVSLVPDVNRIHTIKMAQAAENVSRLVALPTPLTNHTHFFVCALASSSIIHLSLWSELPLISSEQELKEQIRLNAGALKAISDVWPSARLGYRQVTRAGQMIYASRKDAAGDVFWRDFMQDDIMAGLLEDDPLSGQFLIQNPSILPSSLDS